jgi:hypothetical protein
MDQVKDTMVQNTVTKGYRLFSPLPFFVKFMGDGILFLWNSSTSCGAADNMAARIQKLIGCLMGARYNSRVVGNRTRMIIGLKAGA